MPKSLPCKKVHDSGLLFNIIIIPAKLVLKTPVLSSVKLCNIFIFFSAQSKKLSFKTIFNPEEHLKSNQSITFSKVKNSFTHFVSVLILFFLSLLKTLLCFPLFIVLKLCLFMPTIPLSLSHTRQINSDMNQEQMKHKNLRKYVKDDGNTNGWQLITGNSRSLQ